MNPKLKGKKVFIPTKKDDAAMIAPTLKNHAIEFANWLWGEPQFTQWTDGPEKSTEELYEEFVKQCD